MLFLLLLLLSSSIFVLRPASAQCQFEQLCCSPDSKIHPAALNNTSFPEVSLRI